MNHSCPVWLLYAFHFAVSLTIYNGIGFFFPESFHAFANWFYVLNGPIRILSSEFTRYKLPSANLSYEIRHKDCRWHFDYPMSSVEAS